MKDSKILSKILGFAGIGLCGLCCLLPFIGVIAGTALMSTIVAFMEPVAIILILAGGAAFAFYYLRKRKTVACDIDCRCKDVNNKISTSN
jgi:hypothetical protein